jgi:dihydrofolate synthase/folylpolyglutamate synthase
MKLGLERSYAALSALGDPHEGLTAIVVGGSNGKGSVSAMLERIAREAGLSTGLYTSPHLVRYNERVRLGGAPIGDDAFADALARVFSDAPDDLTFFETLTMAAFVAFRDARVDLAILEVGLGGRLDATNVIPSPLATAIVSLTRGEGGKWLEHADLLGDTVEAIAFEKAGIFKAGVPAVVGPLDLDAKRVVARRARAVGAEPLWEVRGAADAADELGLPRAAVDEEARSVRLPDGRALAIDTRLAGRHQLANAGVAAATALLASRRLPGLAGAIERGIVEARWPGRLERVTLPERGVDVWLDCAHNLDGARALADAYPSIGVGPERTTLVFGALADKAWRRFLEIVAPLAARRFYTEPGGRAPAPLEELARVAEGVSEPDPAVALARAIDETPRGGAVLVTGSIYLVGAVGAALEGSARDPALGL